MESPFAERYGGPTVHYPVGKWVHVPGRGAYVAGLPGSYPLTAAGCDDPSRLLLCRMEVRGKGGPAWRKVRNLGPVEDQAELARITREDEGWDIRMAAIRRIEDQAELSRIAREDADGYVRRVATRRLTSQDELARIAREDANWIVRQTAVEHITDQGELARATRKDADWHVRRAAAERLTRLRA